MKLPISWLSDFVKTDGIDIKDYCDRMTDTGSKVEGYEILGEDIANVVIGRVLSVEPHPDATKLVVCKIDVGEDAPLQIVTGATNVTAGAIVPVAKNGSDLPGGIHIKTGKLRGVVSEGMLCSISELGLTLNDMPDAIADGILLISEPCDPGDDVHDALDLSDTVVEFEITPNRPDCLSVIGLARETAASFDREATIPTPEVKPLSDGDAIGNYISVDIANSALCRRYSAKVVKNVRIAPSPMWLRRRLRAAGVRPINNIVDITNYVMLEYGQPMHAFDYACLEGSHIIVRNAGENETFRSLDDIDHTLASDMLVIADEHRAVALAGVMGGANSEITETTKTVVFESANFLGSSVRTTARRLGMRTESSARFEKGMDEENTIPALLRACELVQLLDAGDVVDGMIDVYPNPKPTRTLKLEPDVINRFIGISLDGETMRTILRSLAFDVNGDEITVPSFRDDVECMNDIAEEVTRIYGYNRIPSTLMKSEVTLGGRSDVQKYSVALEDALCGMGLSEINTFSFISPKYYDKIAMPADDARRNSVVISNPLGEDTSIMRTTALPSMLEVLARNDNYHSENSALYELATVYLPKNEEGALPDEKLRLVIGMYGEGYDFYRIKGVVEAVLYASSIEGATFETKTDDTAFHPGVCAIVRAASGEMLGTVGEIHPTVAKNYGIGRRVYAADLDFEALYAARNTEKQYRPLPKFPASTRDFSFVCDESLEVGKIQSIMLAKGGKLTESVALFDVYRGAQLGEGKKSVSFKVSLRAADRTLTDEEVEKCVAKMLRALEQELGITIRS